MIQSRMVQFVVYQQDHWVGTASSWVEAIQVWERWADAVTTATRHRPSDRHQRIEERHGIHRGWRNRRYLDDLCGEC